MIHCTRCGRRAQLYLCQPCTTELHTLLTSLVVQYHRAGPEGTVAGGGSWWIERRSPGLLEYLEHAALGQTRLGVSARHSTDHTTPLPFNANASDLLQEATHTLSTWAAAITTPNTEGQDSVQPATRGGDHR